jgi:chromosome segregation ATPase
MSEVQEAPKVAANVVTSENLAEFNAKKMGLADKAPVAAAVETPPAEPTETQSQSEPLGEDEATATEERKRNPKLELRFEKITKQREEARQEAKREREARESLEAKIRELEGKVTPKAETQPTGEPKPENFTDMYEYAKALTDYRVEQRMGEEKQKEAQAKQQAEREKVINAWTDRVKAAKSEMPDFDDMVGSADVVVSNEVRDAIFESDVGPRILYHLAENPEFAEKLSGMTVASALRSIGKLEAQFEKTEPTSKTVVGKSKAPAPINPIRSAANGRDVPLTSDGKFEGSYQAYKAARMAGRIR